MDRTSRIILAVFGIFFGVVIVWVVLTAAAIMTMPPLGG